MLIVETDKPPKPGESLAEYVRRVRTGMNISQAELAKRSGIHLMSVGKIEGGKTTRLSAKTKVGLSRALQISDLYLEAVCRGVPVTTVQQLKICPNCWVPGTEAESMWLHVRSKYCFACGTALRERCVSCSEPMTSTKHRFCAYCGKAYK
ncbi:MAG: zinc ribbon domain-containing protein [Chroococcidiopsidaceae cyanobacterium CP_BM_RX_35]|nr:zinc ribbon domain-containing protein [Chroococcidiopsidaceae cyanobacterium CP_BM_RX_35]